MEELLIQEILSKSKAILHLLEQVEQDTILSTDQEQLKKHLKSIIEMKNLETIIEKMIFVDENGEEHLVKLVCVGVSEIIIAKKES